MEGSVEEDVDNSVKTSVDKAVKTSIELLSAGFSKVFYFISTLLILKIQFY